MELLELAIPMWDVTQKLPDPELLLLYRGFEDRDVWLDTEISLDTCSMLIKYIQYLNRADSENMKLITLHIASPGGELSTMFMLYRAIHDSKIPVHTINEGGAHSAAFIVFLAGHERTMLPEATFVAHEGSGMMGGSFRENKMALKQYEKDVLKMKEIIVENTNFTMEELESQFEKDQDFYIGYDLALEKGVITSK